MINIYPFVAEHIFVIIFFVIGCYAILGGAYSVLEVMFGGERYVPKKKQEAPKKIYRPKSKFIQKLLIDGKTEKVFPEFFIEDHTFNGSKLLFKNHDEKCEFLSICDIIQYHDGFITDFEIGQIAVTKKLVANLDN